MQKYFVYSGARNGGVIEMPKADVGYRFFHPIQGERLTEREYQALSKKEKSARFEVYEVTSSNEVKFIGRGK